ncbi:MAG: hypothetical protein ABI778_03175 [Ignavibacteriota bacterium]
MKTRTFSLPLVILFAIIWVHPVSAQSVAHSPLFSYLDRLPDPPAFPDDRALLTTPPEHFEEHSELNAMESNLEALLTPSKINPEAKTDPTISIVGTAPPLTDQSTEPTMNSKLLGETMLATLRDMQAVKTEFQENFQRLENAFSQNLDKAYDISRKLQRDQPCGVNTTCQKEHFRLLNSDIVSATKEKLKNEEYLLKVYMSRVKPSFRALDQILAGSGYGDSFGGGEIKKLAQSIQLDQKLLLKDLIERIKLERITISNCARLTQQYQN